MPLPDQMGTTLLPLISVYSPTWGLYVEDEGPLSDEQIAVLNEQVFIYEKYRRTRLC